VEVHDVLLQFVYPTPKGLHLDAQLVVSPTAEPVGNELKAVQPEPLDEERSLGCQAVEAAVCAFGDVPGQVVAKGMKQGDVRRVGFVPVTSFVLIAPGATIDEVVAIVAATVSARSMVVDGECCTNIFFGNAAVAAPTRRTLACHFMCFILHACLSLRCGEFASRCASILVGECRTPGAQLKKIGTSFGKQLLLIGEDALQVCRSGRERFLFLL
jgi:hypothetical protein